MSQSLFSSDSSSARTLRSIDMSTVPPAPPPPPPPGENPAERSNQAASAPSSRSPQTNLIDSDGQTVGDSGLAAEARQAHPERRVDQKTEPTVRSKPLPPPPPPPRATLPPVRPISEVSGSRSGIGSANTRWRGSLPEINVFHSDPRPSEQPPEALAGTEEEKEEDVTEAVKRSAPSWLLSMVVHLIVLLILALITSPVGNGFTNLVLDFGISDDAIEDGVELDLSTPITDEIIDAPQDAINDALEETEIPDIFEAVAPAEMESIEPVILGAESIEISKPMFSGRTGAMRKALMAMYGATDETQDAVKLGLAWLKRQQHKSGYWTLNKPFSSGAFTENRPAATAMAILAFAGDGNTHLSGEYRTEVNKGVKYLVSQQDRGGFMASQSSGNDKTYAQAQATIALCELYGMTKDSWLRAYAQRAIDYAMKAQGANGGWRYRPKEPGDTSVTGWYVMAVQSAIGAGLTVNDSKVRLISDYLDDASVYYGAGYSYQPGRPNPTETMTAEGLLCRQYLGWDRDHGPMQDGLNLLRTDAPFDIQKQNVYYWYYATQVFHHVGGPHWTEWNNVMRVELPALQIKNGPERGSWAPQKDRWSIGGRLYTTCLSIYCLEVYYRHMPLYKHR